MARGMSAKSRRRDRCHPGEGNAADCAVVSSVSSEMDSIGFGSHKAAALPTKRPKPAALHRVKVTRAGYSDPQSYRGGGNVTCKHALYV